MTQDEKNPTVSVIIPVYNDPEGIETTLESLTSQEYPNDDYEILVVDNGSTDETPAVIKSFAEEYPSVVALSETEIQGSYAARNHGIERASGRILAFVDADMWVEDDWLESIVRVADREEYDYFGCDVEIVPVNQPPTLAEKYNMTTGFPVEKYIEESHFAPTCCLVVRREVIEAIGPFDERLVSGGDKEFGHRVHRHSFTQGYVSEVIMYHPVRDTANSLCKKGFRVGYGRAQLRRYHSKDQFQKLSLLNPKQYFPPNPYVFYTTFKEANIQSYEMPIVYMLEYLVLLSSTLGQFYYRIDKAR